MRAASDNAIDRVVKPMVQAVLCSPRGASTLNMALGLPLCMNLMLTPELVLFSLCHLPSTRLCPVGSVPGVNTGNFPTPSAPQQVVTSDASLGYTFPHILFPTVSHHPLFSSYRVGTSLVLNGWTEWGTSVRKDAEDICSFWSSSYYTWRISSFALSSHVRDLIE